MMDQLYLSKCSDGCRPYTIQIPFSLQEMQPNMAGILFVFENPKLYVAVMFLPAQIHRSKYVTNSSSISN
jgi:hypothetical protein